jgi:hypothetical protein
VGVPATDAEFDRLNTAAEEAAVALADTQPATMAGAVALLRHAVEYGDTFESFEDMHQTLADALEEMKASA